MRKKGQLEMELSARITQWEKEYLGRGSLTCKADLLRDLAIVTLQGVLTPAEYDLATKSSGREQFKEIPQQSCRSGTHSTRVHRRASTWSLDRLSPYRHQYENGRASDCVSFGRVLGSNRLTTGT